MSRSSARPDDLQDREPPRWPVLAGATALLLLAGLGGYTAGVFVSENRAQVEEMSVVSGILVQPEGAPDEAEEPEEEPEEETHPAGIDPEVSYALLSVHGGRAVDVAGAAQDNGAHVHLWDRHDDEHQQWRFVPVDDGFYEILGVASGKLLEFPAPPDPETGEGASLLSRTGAPEQQWRVIEVGDGVVRLVNRADGRALGNQDGEEENRTLLTPAEDEGHPHQQWRLVPVG